MFLSMILQKLAAWRLYRQTVRELYGLSDRELADLGFSRYDIPSVARRAVS